MFSKKSLCLAFVGILAVAMSPAMAELIHSSTENYSSLGGTRVLDDLSGAIYTVGAWSPDTVVWEVKEKAVYDRVSNTTDVSYTVFNDTFVDPITSFFAPMAWAPISISAPVGWTGVWANGSLGAGVYWSTANVAFGIPAASSLNTMHMVVPNKVIIVLAPGTAIDFLTPQPHYLTSPDWVVTSVVPAPGAALLLGLGLSLVGFIKRRMA